MSDDDHVALVHASVHLLQDARAPEHVREHPREFFESMGLADEHIDAFVGLGSKRVLLYRKLVRQGIRDAIRKLIPCTAARLGDAFPVWADRYCNEEMPHSLYLRDVAAEFVTWVTPHWLLDATIPAYLADLARWEVLQFQVAIAIAERPDIQKTELQLDRPVVFDGSVRLAHFEYAVQRLADDEMDREEPVKESTWLLAYRDSEYEWQCLELNELAAAIVERLLAGKMLGEAVKEAFGDVPPPHVLQSIAQVLADLSERNVLLGRG
ncbi:MAG TPA: putative DNA-binding domain-containing protein [Polyangium sp.]|nr:putative DNA-binding domain-containing protein [Polyangium sp.]